jgi:hypothetical protein
VDTLRRKALAAQPKRPRHTLINALLGHTELRSDLLAGFALNMRHYKDFPQARAQLFDCRGEMLPNPNRQRLAINRWNIVVEQFLRVLRIGCFREPLDATTPQLRQSKRGGNTKQRDTRKDELIRSIQLVDLLERILGRVASELRATQHFSEVTD